LEPKEFIEMMRSRLAFLALGLTALTALTTPAFASPATLLGTQDYTPGNESYFSLNFVDFGLLRQSAITSTNFALQFDSDPNPTGSASFLSYDQNVDPVFLPNPTPGEPDISTGPITVEIIPGSSGVSSYDPLTGIFSTTELYKVTYTNDLSQFGLTDPNHEVILPSTSTGVIIYDTVDSGRIQQTWLGRFDLNGLVIDFQCAVNTVFTPEPTTASLLGLAGLALLRRRRR
jgi:hypothetical protein